jgi:ATP-dependent Clp protease ATP-binding subunit ClpA
VFQLYTDELRRVLTVAQKHAVQRQLDGVGVEHLLIALIEYGRGPVEEAFFAIDVTPSEAGALYELLAVQLAAGSVETPLGSR